MLARKSMGCFVTDGCSERRCRIPSIENFGYSGSTRSSFSLDIYRLEGPGGTSIRCLHYLVNANKRKWPLCINISAPHTEQLEANCLAKKLEQMAVLVAGLQVVDLCGLYHTIVKWTGKERTFDLLHPYSYCLPSASTSDFHPGSKFL